MKKQALTIGELSRRTGVPVKTLRFWSDEGLLCAVTQQATAHQALLVDLGFDELGQKRQGLLPAKVTTLDRDGAGDAFLNDG